MKPMNRSSRPYPALPLSACLTAVALAAACALPAAAQVAPTDPNAAPGSTGPGARGGRGPAGPSPADVPGTAVNRGKARADAPEDGTQPGTSQNVPPPVGAAPEGPTRPGAAQPGAAQPDTAQPERPRPAAGPVSPQAALDTRVAPQGPGIGYGYGSSSSSSTNSGSGLEPVFTAQAGGSASPAGSGSTATSRNAYSRTDAYSLIPYTRRGYVGLNVTRSDFKDIECGAGGYACDNPDGGLYLYTGGYFNDWVGVELGYYNTGEGDRAGGKTRAQGGALTLVLRAPLGPFNVFAKGGGNYSQTRVSTGLLSDLPRGKRSGWGATYGGGIGFDFTPNSGVVLEWLRNEVRYPGPSGREDVDSTSLGYVYRF